MGIPKDESKTNWKPGDIGWVYFHNLGTRNKVVIKKWSNKFAETYALCAGYKPKKRDGCEARIKSGDLYGEDYSGVAYCLDCIMAEKPEKRKI